MMTFSHRNARKVTTEILDKTEAKVFCWETLARDLLDWMSEAEVQRFAASNGYTETTEENE